MAKNLSERLKILMTSEKTVFRTKDLVRLWQENSKNTVVVAKRMVSKGLIVKLFKGCYSLNDRYNEYELANIIVAPSYVSFNSALFYSGVCFQISSDVQSVALLNYQRDFDSKKFKYHAMKKTLFYNLEGIIVKNNLSIATPERAFLDSLYFGLTANVDNWEKINKTYLFRLAKFYPKTVQDKIKKI